MQATAGSARPGRRALAAALTLAIAAFPAISGARADHGTPACEGQDVPISKYTLADAERTSLCLVNLYRKDHGLSPLLLHQSLATAARLHSEDMVARDYFDHVAEQPAPNGELPPDRAFAAGYTPVAGVGENIGISPNPTTTPHDLFDAWRSSPEHEANMLGESAGEPMAYEAAAVGLAIGAPEVTIGGQSFGPDGVTGTQIFGTEADGATATALGLADGNAATTAGCKAAKDARGDARGAWLRAKKARRRVQQKLRETDSPKREAELSEMLTRKRKLVAKRRAALRRATEKRQAVC